MNAVVGQMLLMLSGHRCAGKTTGDVCRWLMGSGAPLTSRWPCRRLCSIPLCAVPLLLVPSGMDSCTGSDASWLTGVLMHVRVRVSCGLCSVFLILNEPWEQRPHLDFRGRPQPQILHFSPGNTGTVFIFINQE